jgi:hypothetical protein
MGEAKRRREAAGRTTTYRDIATGDVREARCGGDPMVIRDNVVRMAQELRGGPRFAAKVPCNGCTACCHYKRVDVYPGQEDLTHLDVVADDRGHALRKRADGACVHLGSTGCTVHQHRPRACRQYDCRLFSLFGVAERYDGDHQQPVWLFEPKNDEAKGFMGACLMMGTIEVGRRQRAGEQWTPIDIVNAVVADPMFDKAADAIMELVRLSPAERNRMLGHDPEKLSFETLQSGYRMLGVLP